MAVADENELLALPIERAAKLAAPTPTARRLRGLLPVSEPLDPSDLSLAKAVDPNDRSVNLNSASAATRVMLGDDQNCAGRQLTRLLDVESGIAIKGAEPVAKPATDGAAGTASEGGTR